MENVERYLNNYLYSFLLLTVSIMNNGKQIDPHTFHFFKINFDVLTHGMLWDNINKTLTFLLLLWNDIYLEYPIISDLYGIKNAKITWILKWTYLFVCDCVP